MVEATKVDGMRDFLTLPASHPFLMKNNQAMEQAVHFLRHGRFRNSEIETNRSGPG